ncbi:MAG: hypothetical protein HY744_30440 [Deltaproteobacteria bacterium]|nr:hypothetical protein [Deltaproteobacteria bacterium]
MRSHRCVFPKVCAAVALIAAASCEGAAPDPPTAASCGFDVVESREPEPVNPCLPAPGVVTVLGPQVFTREKGPPLAVLSPFSVSSAGTICIIVRNGDGTIETRTAAARLAIDGAELIGPERLNKTVGAIEERLDLEAGDHTIETLVTSKPGSFITVQIRFASPPAAPPSHPAAGANERIVAFNLFDKPDPFSPNGDGTNDETELRADVSVSALPGQPSGAFEYLLRYRFELFESATCERVRVLSGELAVTSQGTVRIPATWDGHGSGGRLMPDGTYYYRLSVEYVRRHQASRDEIVLDAVTTRVRTVTVARVMRELPCHDGAAAPPLKLGWRFDFAGVRQADSLTLRVESREPVSVQLDLVSEGLDFRTVERAYRSLVLAPRQPADVAVSLADLPLQGVSYSSLATVKATITRPDGSLLALHSPPFYHHFSADYESTYVYDFDTMTRELGGGQLTDHAFDLRGRIYQDGQFLDINDVRWTQYSGAPPDQSGPYVDSATPWGDLFPPAAEGFSVCVFWQTRYLDAAHGEDYAASPGTQSLRAAYAQAVMAKVVSPPCLLSGPEDPCVEVVWQGLLDKDGCTKLASPSVAHSYVIWVYSKLQQGATSVDVDYYDSKSVNKGIQRWRLSFYVPPPESILPPFADLTTNWHPTANAAGVMSQLLRAPDLVTSGSWYHVHAGRGCPSGSSLPVDDACGPSPDVYTGPWVRSVDGEPGDLQYKYVIGHEAGHVVQAQGSGMPKRDYFPDIPVTSDLCRCDHVWPANDWHCLQSAEFASTAQAEGFPHFVAARLFNDAAGPDCHFNYYKEFLDEDHVKHPPPYDVGCRNAVKWRDKQCFHAAMGTEYDWMQFYWNVNTVGSNTTSMKNLYAIYKSACGGWCSSEDDVTWEVLRSAAASHYGPSDPKYIRFRDDGDDFSVDEDK